jgi:deoxyribose-phosphate aldolase
MTRDELAGLIDLTSLRPEAKESEIERLLEDARRYPFASVCVPPCYVALARRGLEDSGVAVSTVVGFPLGYQKTGVKLAEAALALEEGAAELDVVMNISAFLSGRYGYVAEEIEKITAASGPSMVKVIIEACYLTDEEKRAAALLSADSGAAFVKTSTGFARGGATVADVRLLKDAVGDRARVKAAGGISTLASSLEMIGAGAERIGASRGVEIIEELGG